MTAPDPGLTDLIAAHDPGDRWTEFTYPPAFSDKPFVATSVTKMVNCSCGEAMTSESHPAHVALVVEQHTNGRIAELEAERDQAIAHDRQPYPTAWAYEQACAALEKHRKRADKHEATIARVEKALEAAEKSVPDDWGVTYIYTSHLRAALEGEQQWIEALKPRTVNSAAELHTLPVESVVRNANGWIGEISIVSGKPVIFWIGNECEDELKDIALPATVLFTPGDAG